MTNNNSLADEINDIELLIKEIQSKSELDVKSVVKAAEKSQAIIKTIGHLTEHVRNKDVENFIKQMLLTIKQLQKISNNHHNAAPPPHKIMSNLTSAFEGFLNKTISKKNQENLRYVASYIPIIDSIAYCCETMPYYWTYTNRKEKVALILGLILIITAVVLTIAMNISPAIAGIMLMGPAVMCCLKLGLNLYRYVVATPKNKFEDMQKIKQLKGELKLQENFLIKELKRISPPTKGRPITNSKEQINKKSDISATILGGHGFNHIK